MKEGWEYKKLGEICDFRSGFAFKSNKFTKMGEPIIRISDIQNEEIDDSNLVYFDPKSYTEDLSKYLIYPDDILIAMSGGTTGKLGINTSKRTFYLNQRVGVFRENKKYLNHRYLYYFLHTKSEESLRIAAGAAQPNLSTAQIKSFIIPVPPLSQQQSIVDYLDSAFAKIDAMKANAEKSLNEAKALFQASLKEMLEPKEGWKEKKLGEMSEIQSGFAFKSTQFQKRGEFQVIRMGNVRPGIIRYNESPVFIDSVDENTIEKSLLKVGDMIITQTGSRNKRDYGFTVLIDKEKLLLNQRIARIRVGNTITNKYLLYYSWTDYFRDQYFANEGGTVGQGNVGIDAIRYAVISYPSLSEQQSIVATLDSLKSKVDKLQENYDKISQECDALKQAILRQVFE